MLPLIRPDVSFDDVAGDIRSILASGRLTGGPYLERFETRLSGYLGVRHVIATSSATTALHLSLAALGIGPDDEVLVSDFTFPATGNVVVQLGARPVLVDSLADSFSLDVRDASAKVTSRTKAIVPVDPFGQPADLQATTELAAEHGLVVVEDAACALGSSLSDVPCGAWPNAGCFSFHPRKVITTGEGGAVTTDDDELAANLRRLRNHGGVSAETGMQFVDNGFNYRLAEIPAALGLSQLKRLDPILDDRRRTASLYDALLAEIDGIELRFPTHRERWSYQSYVVMLSDHVDRDAVVVRLRETGIETTLGTYSLHGQPSFARFGYSPGGLPNSWHAQRQSLTLPLVPRMAEVDIQRVVHGLASALQTAALTPRAIATRRSHERSGGVAS